VVAEAVEAEAEAAEKAEAAVEVEAGKGARCILL